MVSVDVEMNDMGVRFTFDASNLNESGIKQAVAGAFKSIQDSLINKGDLNNMRVLNPKGTTVHLDQDTKRAMCTIPFIDIHVQKQHVPEGTSRAVVVEDTTTDPELANRICDGFNNILKSTSPDSEMS